MACLGYSPPYNYPKQIKRKVEGGEQNRREEEARNDFILKRGKKNLPKGMAFMTE